LTIRDLSVKPQLSKSEVEKIAKTIPYAKPVYTMEDAIVYEVIIPENKEEPLTWAAQEVEKPRGERGKQAAMFDPELAEIADAIKHARPVPDEIKAMMRDVRECASVICGNKKGIIVRGSSACGDASTVSVDLTCPGGTKAIAINHNHPSGINLPSPVDVETMNKFKIKMCIRTPEGITCYKPEPGNE